MLPWTILLYLLVRCNCGVYSSDCHERCPVPAVNRTRDCPKFGFDCHRPLGSLGLFAKSTSCNVNKLKQVQCGDPQASLFVEGQVQRKLHCVKRNGQWKSSKCQQVKSALCAKSCVSCARMVPSFVSVNAVSISTTSGKTEDVPCTVGFCDLDAGFTLMGVDAKTNKTSTIAGNVTCTGDGWMDSKGKTYAYAVCAYYVCAIPTTIPEPVSNPERGSNLVPAVAIGSRMIACPDGTVLAYTTSVDQHSTRYALLCGANAKWTLFGIDIDDISLTVCVYQTITCSVDVSSFPSDCAADEVGCVTPTVVQRTLPYTVLHTSALVCDNGHTLGFQYTLGSPDTGDIVDNRVVCQGNTLLTMLEGNQVTAVACHQYNGCPASLTFRDGLCADDGTDCTTAVVKPYSVSCANDNATLIAGSEYVYGGLLTCTSDQEYSDTGRSNVFSATDAECTTQKQLSCKPLPWLFATDANSYEYPPGATLGAITDVAISIDYDATPPRLAIFSNQNTEFYINNDFSNYVWNLTCNSNGQWIASNGEIATNIGKFKFTNCPFELSPITGISGINEPPSPAAGSTPDVAFYDCGSGTLYYQIGGGTPVKINGGTGSGHFVNCAPNMQRMILDLQLMVPADTKFGCGPS